jgi:hypothetical protein
MAVIQIPMGGGQIGIDVPDFAMEATQQDIAAYAAQQVTALNAIAVKIGANLQGQTTQNQNNQRNDQQQQQQLQQQTTILGGVRQLLSNVNGGVGAVMSGIQEDTELSKLADRIFTGMGLPRLGAAVGTIVGVFEEFGNQMSSFSRIGAGVGTNLIQLRNDAANVGLGLDQLAKISIESGAAMSSLGSNTTDGVNKFVKFTSAFRDATREFGYFGMSSAEMAQFTADELELRRQMYDTEYNRNLNEQDLAVQMKENLNLQSAMARITGQDVRARIKAQQDFQRDSINAGIMASLSKEQQESLKAATGGLSQLGSGGAMITEGLRNMVAGMPAELAPGFAEFSAVLSSQGVDVKGAMEQINGMIASGADPATISAAVDALAGQVKNVDPSAMVTLAIGGVEGASAALQTRVETIASGAETMSDSVAKINTALGSMATAVEDRSALMMGLQANTEQFMVGLQNDVTNAILGSLGIDASNVDTVNAQIGGWGTSLAEGSNALSEFVTTLTGNTMRSSGGTTAFGIVADEGGIGAPRPGQQNEGAVATSLVLESLGFQELATIARMPMTIFNSVEMGATISNISGLSTAAAQAAEAWDIWSAAVRNFAGIPGISGGGAGGF